MTATCLSGFTSLYTQELVYLGMLAFKNLVWSYTFIQCGEGGGAYDSVGLLILQNEHHLFKFESTSNKNRVFGYF